MLCLSHTESFFPVTCFVLPRCFSLTSEGKEKEDVWDHLGPISLVALPKDRVRGLC